MLRRLRSAARPPCVCAECRQVAAIAKVTREFPGAGTSRLLSAFVKCPRAGTAWRSQIRPLVTADAAAMQQLDAESFADASTHDGNSANDDDDAMDEEERLAATPDPMPRTLPDLADIRGWRAFRNYPLLQAQWTAHSNAKNIATHPQCRRLTTDFTRTKHDYYIDGEHVNKKGDPLAYKSPSSFDGILYAPFDSTFISRTVGTARLATVFLDTVLTASDVLKAGKGDDSTKLGRCWPILARNHHKPEKVRRFWERLCDDFVHTPTAPVRECQAEFTVAAPAWAGKSDAAAPDFGAFQKRVLDLRINEVRSEWDDARDGGSDKHEIYDKFIQHEPLPEGARPSVGFLRSMADLSRDYDMFGTEVGMFIKELRALGVADLLCVNRATGLIHVMDFKNCKDDDLNAKAYGGKTGIHPFTAQFPANKFNKYRFQLSYYWYILNRDFFPGRMSPKMLLLNYQPAHPDEYQMYPMDVLDMTSFFALMPWDPKDPRHLLISLDASAPLVPPFANDDDPRCKGPTTLVRLARGTDLAPNQVWTGGAVKSAGYPPLAESPWKHKERWFKDVPPHIAPSYEHALLRSPALLAQLSTLVGKELVCWCGPGKTRCNADVLVKYANLLHHGAIVLPVPGVVGSVAIKKE